MRPRKINTKNRRPIPGPDEARRLLDESLRSHQGKQEQTKPSPAPRRRVPAPPIGVLPVFRHVARAWMPAVTGNEWKVLCEVLMRQMEELGSPKVEATLAGLPSVALSLKELCEGRKERKQTIPATGLSKSSVCAAIKGLTVLGALKAQRRAREDGVSLATRYRVCV